MLLSRHVSRRCVVLVAIAATMACLLSAGGALAVGDANTGNCSEFPGTEASPGFRAYLPDCRAYEMVTPSNKKGALVKPVHAATVAADGSSLAGGSPEAFAGLGNGELIQLRDVYYRFTRTGSGWITTPLNPVRGELESIGLDDSVWGPAERQSAVAHLRLVQADGSVSDIGSVWPSALGPNQNGYPFFVRGAAGDASHGVVFTIEESSLFWPFDTTLSAPSLYEYTGTGGSAAPSLVGVSGGAGSTTLISRCGTILGASGFVGGGESEYNAVSEDGSRVFFTAAGADSVNCGGTQPPANELFARIGGSQTVAVSEPSMADCPACNAGTPMDARFEGASADGSRVFFTTAQPLLGADTSKNLYEYDFNPPSGQPRVVRVSGGDSTVSNPIAEVQDVSRISLDGSHVYFVAHGVLTTDLNNEGENAHSGADNLYLYERDAQYPAGRTAFIAELCSEAGKSGTMADPQCPSNLGSAITDQALWGGDDTRRPAQATPDGRFLVFTSHGDLTAGDTSTAAQVFEYDAQTGKLVRVSIGLDGYNDNGNTTGSDNAGSEDASIVTQDYGPGARGGAIARTMSDTGAYVFFQSPVALTSQALNDVPIGITSYAPNVYEYHDGQTSLISDGKDTSPTLNSGGALIGTSASGADVFFRTADQLVPQDTDTQVDFYDARIGGGFPAPAGSAGCQDDGCQGSQRPPPLFGSPSSATFSGAGNLAPPVSKPAVKPRALTAAQKLSRALKACRTKHNRRKRTVCEHQARKRYGPTKAKKASHTTTTHKGGK